MDIVIFYGREEHIVELKIWRGPQAEDAAYGQLAAYLKSRGQARGWLVSFADTLSKPREDSSFEYDDCTITETVIAYRDQT
jgi:hypothetical protein